MTGIKAQTQALTPAQILQIQKQMLNRLIETKLLRAKATDADNATGKKMEDVQITALKENAGSQEAFDQRLKTLGITKADLSAKITQEATAQAVFQRELKVVVTHDEVNKYYDGHTADYEQPEMARVRHILIFTVDPATHAALPADQQLSRRRKADDLVKAARGGADFAALAKQYSEDPGSKENGGVLPYSHAGRCCGRLKTPRFHRPITRSAMSSSPPAAIKSSSCRKRSRRKNGLPRGHRGHPAGTDPTKNRPARGGLSGWLEKSRGDGNPRPQFETSRGDRQRHSGDAACCGVQTLNSDGPSWPLVWREN
jgi:hypothetical protein